MKESAIPSISEFDTASGHFETVFVHIYTFTLIEMNRLVLNSVYSGRSVKSSEFFSTLES